MASETVEGSINEESLLIRRKMPKIERDFFKFLRVLYFSTLPDHANF